MNRRPPELKTTDTLFPYTRPFRTEEKRRHRPIRRKRCRGPRAEAQRPGWRRPAGRPARPPEAGCRILSAGPDDPARPGGRLLRAGGQQSRSDPAPVLRRHETVRAEWRARVGRDRGVTVGAVSFKKTKIQ